MKKHFAGAIALVMLLVCLCAGASHAEGRALSVVTTIFPIYDWVREIVGDSGNVEITLLLDNGVDMHSYQPTATDIMKLAACDVFAYVGGESDEWAEDALAESMNPDRIVVNLVDAMGGDIRKEETVEGMEREHGHEPDEDEAHEHDGEADSDHEEDEHDHEDEVDEHVWLSLRNAQRLVKALADALSAADPIHAGDYAANAAVYIEKLKALDGEYAAVREAADFDTLLFGDRFPFRYMVEDYDLKYYAAFSGCSAESEASFETVAFLARKVDELGLTTVLTIEGDNHRIAETIVENTRAKDAGVLAMDSMQATTGEDAKNGVTYLGVMQADLEVLKQALTR